MLTHFSKQENLVTFKKVMVKPTLELQILNISAIQFMKSGVGHCRKLLGNEMRHDIIMSKQCGQPHVFGVKSDQYCFDSVEIWL